MSNNSVLEELRVRRLAVIQEDMMKGILQVGDAWVEVVWVKWEEQLGVVCIKVMIKGKGRDESAERVVYMIKSRGPRTEPWGTPQEEV